MLYELCYTSAPRGLFGHSAGFSTVKATQGMPVALRELLESLSTFRHLSGAATPGQQGDPVSHSLVIANAKGKRWYVLSRIQAAGLDHTQRSNFFAHHIATDDPLATLADPTALLNQPGFLSDRWDRQTNELASRSAVPAVREVTRPCLAWKAVTNDAGWAGAVAGEVLAGRKACLVFDALGTMLPLVSELAGLLPPAERWNLTFSTYFCSVPASVDCRLRCVVAGSEEARAAQRQGAYIVDLTHPLGKPPADAHVGAARAGTLIGREPIGVPGASTARHPSEAVGLALAGQEISASGRRGTSRRTAAPGVSPSPENEWVPTGVGASLHDSQQSQPPSGTLAWSMPVGGVLGLLLTLVIAVPILLGYRNETRRQRESLAALQEERDSLAARLKSVESASAEELAKLAALQQTSRTQKEQGNIDQAVAKKAVEVLDSQIADKNRKLQAKHAELATKEAELATTRQKLERTEGLRAAEAGKVARFTEEIKQLRKENGELRREVESQKKKPRQGPQDGAEGIADPQPPKITSLLPLWGTGNTPFTDTDPVRLGQAPQQPKQLALEKQPPEFSIAPSSSAFRWNLWFSNSVVGQFSYRKSERSIYFKWTTFPDKSNQKLRNDLHAALSRAELLITAADNSSTTISFSK